MDVKYVEAKLVNHDYLLICFFIFTYSFQDYLNLKVAYKYDNSLF